MITTYPNPPSAAMKAKAKARRRLDQPGRRVAA